MMDFKGLKELKIAVVGDVMVDRYIHGSVDRISPEAPVPVLLEKSVEYRPGGAANVALNLKALGCNVKLIGVIGDDVTGESLVKELKEKGIITHLFMDPTRPTTLKTRVIAASQQIVRIDREKTHKIDEKFIKKILDELNGIDAIIISDYGKGVITKKLISGIKKFKCEIISVDPKIEHFMDYSGFTFMTPNLKEAFAGILEHYSENMEVIKKVGFKILKKLKLKFLVITMGAKGMLVFHNKKAVHIPTLAKEVYDVTGAGDTVIAALTAFYALTKNVIESAKLANIAAKIKVGKFGAAAVSIEEIERDLKS